MGAPVVHFEIGCRDTKKTCDFYSRLLGWEISQEGPAKMISTGGQGGITGHIQALGHPPHNYVTVYAQVADIAATLKKAEQLGGKTLVPKTEVPGMGHFAWFTDPEGNALGLWTPAAA